MKNRWSTEINTIVEIAEMKRIFTVLNSSFDDGPVVIMGTSALSGEGKTTITAGLAAVAALETGKRTLAVDLNWYAPALHKAFGLQLECANSCSGSESLQELVCNCGHNGFDMLPAFQFSNGNGKNPVMFVNNIIHQAREQYDFIVLDTSKIFPTNRNMLDPVVIAGQADGVFLVALAGDTPRQQVKRAKVILETAGANLIGVIMNHGS